jgi:hypothetical protein
MNTTQLFLGLIFSCIGLGYFMYGKKQKVIVPLVCGLVLMIFLTLLKMSAYSV